jgi:hypothetical protein
MPDSGLRSNNVQWDFWTLSPESAHQATILMSDRGTPRTWRHMKGYSSDTYMWENAAGEKFWAKYHFKTEQGIQNFTDAETIAMRAQDLDCHRRDLREAIAREEHPHADCPPITVGRFVLEHNPENFFAQIVQAGSNQLGSRYRCASALGRRSCSARKPAGSRCARSASGRCGGPSGTSGTGRRLSRVLPQQESEPLGCSGVGEYRTAQCRIRGAADHRRLDGGHEFAGFGPERGESENLVAVSGDQHLHETARLGQGPGPQHGGHRQGE